jgi:hypothetical protein
VASRPQRSGLVGDPGLTVPDVRTQPLLREPVDLSITTSYDVQLSRRVGAERHREVHGRGLDVVSFAPVPLTLNWETVTRTFLLM